AQTRVGAASTAAPPGGSRISVPRNTVNPSDQPTPTLTVPPLGPNLTGTRGFAADTPKPTTPRPTQGDRDTPRRRSKPIHPCPLRFAPLQAFGLQRPQNSVIKFCVYFFTHLLSTL